MGEDIEGVEGEFYKKKIQVWNSEMINFQNKGKTKGKLQCQRTRGPISFPGLSDYKQVPVLTIF